MSLSRRRPLLDGTLRGCGVHSVRICSLSTESKDAEQMDTLLPGKAVGTQSFQSVDRRESSGTFGVPQIDDRSQGLLATRDFIDTLGRLSVKIGESSFHASHSFV